MKPKKNKTGKKAHKISKIRIPVHRPTKQHTPKKNKPPKYKEDYTDET